MQNAASLPEIQLNTDWMYFFASSRGADYSARAMNDAAWIPLLDLTDWSVTNAVQSGADWFRRRVRLVATQNCVRYLLVIDSVPEDVRVYVNGQQVGHVRGMKGFRADVTDQVHLGDNLLAFKLTCSSEKSGGRFGRVALRAVPCG